MTTVEFARTARAAGERWYGHAFGIALESEEPFDGMLPADGPAARVTSWREAAAGELAAAWHPRDGTPLLERRHPDGRLFLRVEGHEEIGYRIWAPYYGRHLVSSDGRSIASALPRVPPVRWQRLFYGEVLPLAAALQGLSLVRGDAVEHRCGIIAIVGAPGAGKTAVTAHLVALGASFVSDGVLSLEARDGTAFAHPGPRRLSLDEAEFRRIPSTQELRVGPCIGRSDRLMLEPQPVACAAAVTRVYVLRRDAECERIGIDDRLGSPGRAVLGGSFLSYLSAGDREPDVRLAAALDSGVRAYDVAVPSRCGARDVAARILAHCGDRSMPPV
jgi:hypothetical protein